MKRLMLMLMLMLMMVSLVWMVSCATQPFDVNTNTEYVELKNKYFGGLENLLSKESPDTYFYLNIWDMREIIPEDCMYFRNYGLSGCPYYQDWVDTIEKGGYVQRINEYNAKVSEVQNNKPKDDVTFLAESSSNRIDFSKRSDEQLMEFLPKAHVYLGGMASLISEQGARTDRRTYDILQNLISHYVEAGRILNDHGKLPRDAYNEVRLNAVEFDKVFKSALGRR
jgi:hypothetical protein